MKTLLYVNGCSHSCGAEISYPLSLRQPKDLELSWCGQIARKYGLIHHNDAYSGQGNDEIFTTSIYSLSNLLKTVPPENILILIGWSSFDRQYQIFQNKKYSFVPGINETPGFQEWPRQVKKAYKNWILGIDDDDSLNKFSLIYFNTINFCKMNHLDYYFFNAIEPVKFPRRNLIHHLYNNSVNTDIFECIKDDDNYLEPFNTDMTYYNYLKQRYNGHIDGRNHHFLPDAQAEWADILDENIQRFLK